MTSAPHTVKSPSVDVDTAENVSETELVCYVFKFPIKLRPPLPTQAEKHRCPAPGVAPAHQTGTVSVRSVCSAGSEPGP